MLKHSNIKYCKHRDLYKPLFAMRSTTIIDLSENSAQPDNCDSTCHHRDHHRGRRIELLHQCQLWRRVGSLANFFIVHANSTVASYNFILLIEYRFHIGTSPLYFGGLPLRSSTSRQSAIVGYSCCSLVSYYSFIIWFRYIQINILETQCECI